MEKRPPEDGAILLMGYGSPLTAEDLPGYLTDVLGRAPAPETVAEYERRYSLIGGSPQNRVIESLRSKLERRLASDRPSGAKVYLATKHWRPHIADVLPQIADDGFRSVRAIPLSPYASTWILRPYETALARGGDRSQGRVAVELRSGWHTNPHLVGYWRNAIRGQLGDGEPCEGCVLLSAHSLPERFRASGDPYPSLVRETADRVARASALPRWEFTYQSAGNTTEPWLGPDITEVMREWKRRGARSQWVASIGFVFDHLETLYDLDVVVRAFAEANGIEYRRVPMPNDADEIVEALRDVAVAPPTASGRAESIAR
jgi:ferrochelatase